MFKAVIIATMFGFVLSVSAQTHKKSQTPAATKTPSAKTDPTAKDAFAAMEKLEAIVESGVEPADYTRALADANFPLKMYLNSDSATAFPDLTDALQNSMKWFRVAGTIWQRKIITDFPYGYCEKWKHPLPSYAESSDAPRMSEDLCTSFPGLVTTISDSRHYDATENTITEERKVIDFDSAQPKAWKLADDELKKAELLMK